MQSKNCFLLYIRDSNKNDVPAPHPNLNADSTGGFELFSGYKVLTPTMYRTRMAAARQAVSMDCYYSYQGNYINHFLPEFVRNRCRLIILTILLLKKLHKYFLNTKMF